MISAANKLAVAATLRVAIHATETSRRMALSRLVADAGYIVVDSLDTADVILADGTRPLAASQPMVGVYLFDAAGREGRTRVSRQGRRSRHEGQDVEREW